MKLVLCSFHKKKDVGASIHQKHCRSINSLALYIRHYKGKKCQINVFYYRRVHFGKMSARLPLHTHDPVNKLVHLLYLRTLILELNNMQASLRKEREGNQSDGGKQTAPVMVNKTTQTGICLKW